MPTRRQGMTAKRVPLSMTILLTASLSLMAQNQPGKINPANVSDFELGQVWTMQEGMTVTILAIEDVHKAGKIVHVRVDGIP
jgi:hypothetical protein